MSYDLYFYKPKTGGPSESQIATYLSENLVPLNEKGNQWFFQNEDTEVYYSFELEAPGDDPSEQATYEEFDGFENTHIAFNLNFMRPNFFGLEAFLFVEKFITEMDLFVMDPQSDKDGPYKPTKEALFERWNHTNLWACKDHYKEGDTGYLLTKISNEIWEYNFNRKKWQAELGQDYFVPRVFFLKTRADNKVITLSTWTQHIPNVFPPADYFILVREYKRLFKTVKDTVLIDRQTLLKEFGGSFEEAKVNGCKILRRSNALKLADKFNSIQSKLKIEKLAERLPMENLFNAKPE